MMSGNVRALHLLLKVPFQVANGLFYEIECVIDTGFTGFSTLPLQDVAALGLTFDRNMEVYLADNSQIEIPVHRAIIQWQNNEMATEVLATGIRPLLGTALLASHQLFADFTENGLLTVNGA